MEKISFVILDFYRLKGASEDNDLVPSAIEYVYPSHQQSDFNFINQCGQVVGLIQYFQHEILFAVPKMFVHQETLIIHKSYGRHSALLTAPANQWSCEKISKHFNTILELFHLLFGTWNQICSLPRIDLDDYMSRYLQARLTPIVETILKEHSNLTYLFTTVDYFSRAQNNREVILDSKHLLEHLKTHHRIQFGIFGYNNQVIYSNWTGEMLFYLQTILRIYPQFNEDHIAYRLNSEDSLPNGVQLYRIYLPKSSSDVHPPIAEECPFSRRLPRFCVQSESEAHSDHHRSYRYGMIFPGDSTPSSGDTRGDTDPSDGVPHGHSQDDSSETQGSPLTEEFALEPETKEHRPREDSHTSSSSEEDPFTATLRTEEADNGTLRLTQVEFEDDDDDEDSFSISRRNVQNKTSHYRFTSILHETTPLIAPRPELRLSWKAVSDRNDEDERKEWILYVQQKAKMIFAGILDPIDVTNQSLINLGHLLIVKLNEMNTKVLSERLTNHAMISDPNVFFQFNHQTHRMEVEKVRTDRGFQFKTPSAEVASVALIVDKKLRENPRLQYLIISSKNHSLMGEHSREDRIDFTSVRRH